MSPDKEEAVSAAAQSSSSLVLIMLSRLLKEHQAKQSERKELQGERPSAFPEASALSSFPVRGLQLMLRVSLRDDRPLILSLAFAQGCYWPEGCHVCEGWVGSVACVYQ